LPPWARRTHSFHGHPRHPPTLGGQRVTGAGQLLLLHEQLLARSLPLPAVTLYLGMIHLVRLGFLFHFFEFHFGFL
jgi:hypothetical protein